MFLVRILPPLGGSFSHQVLRDARASMHSQAPSSAPIGLLTFMLQPSGFALDLVTPGTRIRILVGRKMGKGLGRNCTKFYFEKEGQDGYGKTLSRCKESVQMVWQPWRPDVHCQAFSVKRH